jgi:hypothetical protein
MKAPKLSERELLLLAVSLGLLFVLAGALLGEFASMDGPNWRRLVSTLVLTIGGGLVASGLVGFILMLYRSTGDRRKMALLKVFFGSIDPSREIAIVIPRFPQAFGAAEHAALNQTPTVSVKDGRLTHKYNLAFDDVTASRQISAIFSELGLAPPRIEFDDDAKKSLFGPLADEDKLGKYRMFIVIGLYSNDVTMEFATRSAQTHNRRFRLSSREQLYAGTRGVAYNAEPEVSIEWLTQDGANWDLEIQADLAESPRESSKKRDFALISTCTAPDGRVCIILGGGRARGTRKAASYLRRSWKEIAEFLEGRADSVPGKPQFVAVFDLDGKQHSPARHRGSYPPGVCT